ncbi:MULTISPECIES: hypothetical protein [unclassified Sphingopyxis]|uniref:hypothetical protein n=1 Tax=unclassified Sphingopyxis TaxID=2614943 RepID=UPI0024ACB3DA|nr:MULTISPECIES: hypothetical protein [unclassified Sphingopyxis]
MALEEGRTFAPALPACAQSASPASPLPAPSSNPQIYLLADRSCFSSCLLAADLFLRFAAIHVGEVTDMSSRYMEVRQIILPSGLRTFSTLQKVTIGLGDLGPYRPEHIFDGDMTNLEALERWIYELEAERRR